MVALSSRLSVQKPYTMLNLVPQPSALTLTATSSTLRSGHDKGHLLGEARE